MPTRGLLLAAVAAVILTAVLSGVDDTRAQDAAAPAAAPAAPADDEAARELPPYEPVARITSLMTGFGAASGLLDDLISRRSAPNRADQIVAWSEVIAELSNAHMRHKRDAAYLDMAKDTRGIAIAIARAARAETIDEPGLARLYDQLEASCSRCHDTQ